jgi:hypothetical protein
MAPREVAPPPATPAGSFAEHPALSTANFRGQSSPSGLARGHSNLRRWLLRCGPGGDKDELGQRAVSSACRRPAGTNQPRIPDFHLRYLFIRSLNSTKHVIMSDYLVSGLALGLAV